MDEVHADYSSSAGSRLLRKKLPIVVISPPDEIPTKTTLYSSWMRQIAITSVISIPTYAISFVIASTSFFPAILNSNTTSTYQDSTDVAEAVSFPMLATIPSTLCGFWLSKYFSHGTLLRSSLLSYLVLFAFMSYQRTFFSLIIVRTLLQVLNGIYNSFCFPYITVLTEQKFRGICGAINQLGVSCGIFLAYVLLTYLKPKYAFLFGAIPFVVGLTGSAIIPESPFWLLRCEKTMEAQKSITHSIGKKRGDKVCELYQEVLSDFEESEDAPSIYQQVVLLKKSENWKSLAILVVILILREFGGHSTVFLYPNQMIQQLDIDHDVNFYSVIVGAVAVISSILTILLQNRVGRKKVIISSEILCVISLLVTGSLSRLDLSYGPFLSLIGLLLFTFFSIVGVGPVPFIFIKELAPCEIHILSTFLAFLSYYLSNFIIMYLIPITLETFALGTILFFFASINAIAAAIMYLSLQEQLA